MRYYCTYFDANYLDRGLALHDSMVRHCDPFRLHVLALCRDSYRALKKLRLRGVEVTPINHFMNPALKSAQSGRTWREFIWTCTGSWLACLFERHPELQEVTYLDADSMFFSDPQPLFDEIADKNIAITPHRSSREYRAYYPTNGVYNVGLLHFKRSRAGLGCIYEWAGECIDWCYYRHEENRFCDQKYLDKWPERWGAHAIRHLGVGLAPWNQADQYKYAWDGSTFYVNKDPLIWYHFHGKLDSGYKIDRMVREHCYWPYARALQRAQNRLAEIGAAYRMD